MDTKFAWSTTEKGEKVILYNNYVYHLKRENKNTSSHYVWTFNACSRSITLKNNVIIKSNAENHNREPKLPENVQAVFCGLKRRVLDDVDQPISKIYEEEVKKFRRENGTTGPVPVFQAWKSTLYSIRKTILPPTPLSLSSIIIPGDMYFNNTKQEFLFCNSSTPNKVITFASDQGLKLLSKSPHWNGDGTFRTSPALFTQSYYRHVWDEFSMKPIIYSCCENKSEKCYRELLQSLLTHAEKKNISLNPSSILIDFEQSMINAINDVFPQALVKGCHFHYAQNIWKKVKKYNLVKLSKEENIRRQIANISALPLIPPKEVDNCMEKIIDELSDYDSTLNKLTDYVIKNYIEDARFSFSMRNHFDNIGKRPRTNNHLEGYHRQLNARVRTNPDLWTWINEVKSSEESIMCRYQQEQAQQRTTRPRNEKYIQDDIKLMLAKKIYSR
ncbi:unnamed protein product [Rotaria magnacalcarata]|uniref:MULE transposase domain-containing protein n=1 Tax=Rotaria magnacalcarata TaxID=392030 RepID=A0A815ERK2_9BILA|nr:unnamed protein product [Rotaria magnacalcarata]CAF1315118.1 unnamed protein product [Rotaria magnacalcarata]CAF3919643.1 unnamed protein product [Rotaria magnacalcarata]CAF3970306.1 unnamed protein product [Rotaria magnacalcarata]CAF4057206.1 unnamed protein product [Rotaria magnacalcarata]